MSKPTETERKRARRDLEKLREELPDGSPLAWITDHILWDDDRDRSMCRFCGRRIARSESSRLWWATDDLPVGDAPECAHQPGGPIL